MGLHKWKSDALLMSVASRIVVEQLEHDHFSKQNVVVREARVLMVVSAAPYSQKEVATILGLNTNVLVKLIDKMEKRGLIHRQRNPENRREHILKLGDKGRKFIDWLEREYDRMAKQVWAPLTLEELQDIRHKLCKFIAAHSSLVERSY